ncbi:MAG: shikimate dehydrogenase [Chitinophagaceae bacterium]|nr:MAG: shikimate dehydrogenase [Chitinophagaceae bacterium]
MRKYGLIGKSLGHSFSKKYFDELFLQDGSGNRFELFPLENIHDFPSLVQSEPGLKGVAVTIPYKECVLQFLDRLDETALLTGAVNCISLGDELVGYNTDVVGFEESLKPLLEPHHIGALVLGTGGASKAVQFVLNKLRLPFTLVSRDASKGINYTSIDADLLIKYPVLINCTPVGMYPGSDKFPAIPYHLLGSRNFLFDLIYNPAETIFLKEGKRRGAKTENGLKMLQVQADANLAIWEGTV